MRIRPAVAGDRAFVLTAAQRLSAFGPPPWRSAEDIIEGERRTLEAFFTSPSAGSALLIAEWEEGEPVGFTYLEELQDYFTLELHGHVGMLVVARPAEGKGVGSALMRAAEGWARECGYRTLTLNVFATNHGARAVYEHLGYAPETLRYVKIL